MNRWKTTESVTNEAEIIHFGENVYVELNSLMAGRSVISSSVCMGGGLLKHEVPEEERVGENSLPHSSHPGSKNVGRRGESREGVSLSLAFKSTNLSHFALDYL